jgi:hypothetical protein
MCRVVENIASNQIKFRCITRHGPAQERRHFPLPQWPEFIGHNRLWEHASFIENLHWQTHLKRPSSLAVVCCHRSGCINVSSGSTLGQVRSTQTPCDLSPYGESSLIEPPALRDSENSATSPSTAVSTRRQICLRPRLRLDAPHTSADRLPCGSPGRLLVLGSGPRAQPRVSSAASTSAPPPVAPHTHSGYARWQRGL